MQELPLLLQHIAAATTSRRDVPGGRVLIAGTAGYEGEAAVAAVAHLMHSAASSAHKALVQASQHHMALRVRAHVLRCSMRRRAKYFCLISCSVGLSCLSWLLRCHKHRRSITTRQHHPGVARGMLRQAAL